MLIKINYRLQCNFLFFFHFLEFMFNHNNFKFVFHCNILCHRMEFHSLALVFGEAPLSCFLLNPFFKTF